MTTELPTTTRTITTMSIPTDSSGLLYLLQIATATFPTGAFSHSYGFETLIHDGSIADAMNLRREALLWLRYGIAPSDGVAVAEAYRAAQSGDAERWVKLDALLTALKLTRETREASLSTGMAFLRATLDAFPGEHLDRYNALVASGLCAGHYASAFGVAALDANISLHDALAAFLHSTLSNLISVAARIIPLGQLAVQRILAQSQAEILESARVAMVTPLSDIATSTVQLDIASMAHERLYTRLCIS
ncbi:MAG: urease accessory protein UreF [Burkholderiales bacterium]